MKTTAQLVVSGTAGVLGVIISHATINEWLQTLSLGGGLLFMLLSAANIIHRWNKPDNNTEEDKPL